VNVGVVKNALGVFHCAEHTWLCPAFFSTLTEAQRREGRLEGWKMALGDAALWHRWCTSAPDDETLVRQSRALKARICEADPYERTGRRTVLNFGHTFGHVIEALTRHRVRHGEAVGLGMLCALDVGVAVGVTSKAQAAAIEAALPNAPNARARLARVLRRASKAQVTALLAADKKGSHEGAVRMVLVEKPGQWVISPVASKVWSGLWASWSRSR
jgi:3-dehydroquinate synthase